MEPEKSTVHESQPVDQRIAPANMFAFVGQDRIQLLGRPFLPVFGQNHNRMKPSHCDGARALGTDTLAIPDIRPAHEPMRPGRSDCQPGEEPECAKPVNDQQETLPGPILACRKGPGSLDLAHFRQADGIRKDILQRRLDASAPLYRRQQADGRFRSPCRPDREQKHRQHDARPGRGAPQQA
jgi:hypothetical protein